MKPYIEALLMLAMTAEFWIMIICILVAGLAVFYGWDR